MRIELDLPTRTDYATAFGDLANFKSSGQVFGIIPMDKETLVFSYGMEPAAADTNVNSTTLYDEHLDVLCTYSKRASRKYTDQFKFLSAVQGTRFAVVPIHTKTEINLYKQMVQKYPKFMSTTKQKDWIEFSKLWSPNANGKTIFYKSPDHLRQYSNIMKDRNKYYTTILKNDQLVRKIRQLVQTQQSEFPELPIPAPVMHSVIHETNQVGSSSKTGSKTNTSRTTEVSRYRQQVNRSQNHPISPQNNSQSVQNTENLCQQRSFIQQPIQQQTFAPPGYFVPQYQYQFVQVPPFQHQQPVYIHQQPHYMQFQHFEQQQVPQYLPPPNIQQRSTDARSSSSSTSTFFSTDFSKSEGASSFESMKRTLSDLAPKPKKSNSKKQKKNHD